MHFWFPYKILRIGFMREILEEVKIKFVCFDNSFLKILRNNIFFCLYDCVEIVCVELFLFLFVDMKSVEIELSFLMRENKLNKTIFLIEILHVHSHANFLLDDHLTLRIFSYHGWNTFAVIIFNLFLRVTFQNSSILPSFTRFFIY